jgi:hypothetical protein
MNIHPAMNAKSNPTPAQIRTAIEVLQKLSTRLDAETTHAVVQLPLTELGTRYMDQIEGKAFEQSIQIDAVATQLKGWRDELAVQPAPAGFAFVADLKNRFGSLALAAKALASAQMAALSQSAPVALFAKRHELFAARFSKRPAR